MSAAQTAATVTVTANRGAWKKRDLSALEVVYAFADGLYVKAGLDDRTKALLVIVGALSSGEKVLLACESGGARARRPGARSCAVSRTGA